MGCTLLVQDRIQHRVCPKENFQCGLIVAGSTKGDNLGEMSTFLDLLAMVSEDFKSPRRYRCCCCLVLKSCPTLSDPMDCNPPGSSVRGILQARILEWVCHFLLQGVSLTQGSNPRFLHWQADSLLLSHQGSLRIYYPDSNFPLRIQKMLQHEEVRLNRKEKNFLTAKPALLQEHFFFQERVNFSVGRLWATTGDNNISRFLGRLVWFSDASRFYFPIPAGGNKRYGIKHFYNFD